jgi:hypothetical protein
MEFRRFPIWPIAFSRRDNDQLSVFSSFLKPLHFAGAAGIIYHPEGDCLQNCITDAFVSWSKWVKANEHGLYLDKMNSLKFSNIKTLVGFILFTGHKDPYGEYRYSLTLFLDLGIRRG